MSIKLMTMAFNATVHNPVRKLILIKLCDNANDDGVCWPSYSRIADQCEVSKRSVMEHIKWLTENGFLIVESRFKNGIQTSNSYTISHHQLMVASTGMGEQYAPPLVNVVHPPSEPGSPRIIIESSVESNNVTPIRKNKKKLELTFSEWSEHMHSKNLPLIPSDSPIFEYSENMGIPGDFLQLAWNVFRDYYTTDNLKKYADWRIVFTKAVKGDWLKLWAFNQSGECYLTTKGKQHQNLLSARS